MKFQLGRFRVLRNMFLITGVVTSISFFTGLRTAKGNYYFNYPSKKSFKVQSVSSIDDIEDLEFEKKCKFLFYKSSESSESSIKEARPFQESNSGVQIFEKVNSSKEKCTEDAFVYITI